MKNLLILTALMSCGLASASPFISEIMVNPSGTDDTQEFVEIQGNVGASLANTYFLAIDGDGTASGVIDVVLNLSPFSLGSNGLLLVRDAASNWTPLPEAGTTIVVQDFNPDIENGTQTYLIVNTLVPPVVGTDLDLDNNGTLDAAISGATVLDAFSYREVGSGVENEYGSQFGGSSLGLFASGTSSFNPLAVYRLLNTAQTAPNGFLGYTFTSVGLSISALGLFEAKLVPGTPPTATEFTFNPGSKNTGWPLAPSNQVLSGNLVLADTMMSFASNRTINYTVLQGTTSVATGSVTASAATSAYSITLPAALSGAATIQWDGASFLRRNTTVNLTGANQSGINASLQNGDSDDSGEVDAADIDLVIADFGGTGINTDVDASGEVDAADIDIVIANFGGFND